MAEQCETCENFIIDIKCDLVNKTRIATCKLLDQKVYMSFVRIPTEDTLVMCPKKGITHESLRNTSWSQHKD